MMRNLALPPGVVVDTSHLAFHETKGEAAVAATRGPVGLALFGASRGIQVVRDRRAEQAEVLSELASDAKLHADTLREKTSVLAAPPQRKKPLRRFAPLLIVGLAGGAAVAGATAYFLRDSGSPASSPTPAPDTTHGAVGSAARMSPGSAVSRLLAPSRSRA